MKRLWTLTDPWTRRRAHRSLEIAARFPQAPTSRSSWYLPNEIGEEASRNGHRPADDNNREPPGGGRHSFCRPFAGRSNCRQPAKVIDAAH
jgi:hypothetical protein